MTKHEQQIDGKGGGYIIGGDIATTFPTMWNWIHECVGPLSVLDVGCAEGHFLNYAKSRWGAQIEGCDFSSIALEKCPDNCFQHDLEKSAYKAKQQPEVIWCCEVAEHIEEASVSFLMDTLTQAKKAIFFTHALPGQGGHHHVNCKDPGYWVHKFKEYGWKFNRGLTETSIEKAKKDTQVPWPNHWVKSGMVFTPVKEGKRPLIITVAANYDWETLKPFVCSANRVFSGDLVMLCDNLSHDTLMQLERHGVWVIPCSNTPPYSSSAALSDLSCNEEVLGQMREVYYRFVLYERFLRKYGDDYNHVLLTDSRDVFFQDNPFKDMPDDPFFLDLYFECPEETIGSSPYNAQWIEEGYTKRLLGLMKDQSIVCAGVILGNRFGVQECCCKIIEELMWKKPHLSLRGFDQAALNKMIFKGELKPHLNCFGMGKVWHVGYIPRDRNIDISGTPVVHQYDRHNKLKRKINDISSRW